MGKKYGKALLLLLFVNIYLFLICPLGYKVIDPCSTTPGYENTLGNILLLFYPLLTGLLVYLFYRKTQGRLNIERYIKIVLLVIIISALSFFPLAFLWLNFEYSIADYISGTTIFHHIFYYDECYNELNTKRWVFILLFNLGIIPLSLIALKSSYIKRLLD